ncbi:hypothetical protein CQW32_04885 [Pseudomonas putida]|jgi:hypothetical protein|uniref:hypothetical protein n=1 Tax=Pseudomonas TaxID=286 RepID=UPI000C2AB51D|nr:MULTISPECIES: hypothetical protein [Pseudomonas]PJX11557.1 hypothetical protein CQW32_04885 [Pseudomonas putida]
MKLYENVVIGNFLYALGFAIGRKTQAGGLMPIVNLLQQTPDDKRLADVFAYYPGAMRIIEFKRTENSDDKEEEKLRILKRAVEYAANVEKISLAVHWFVETSVPGEELVSRVVPYLHAYSDVPATMGFTTFVDQTADALLKGDTGCSEGMQMGYLDVLAMCNGSATGKAGRKSRKTDGRPQSSSLILKLSEEGQLAYAQVTSYEELRLRRDELFQRYRMELLAERQEETELRRSQDYDIGPEPTRGQGMSFRQKM